MIEVLFGASEAASMKMAKGTVNKHKNKWTYIDVECWEKKTTEKHKGLMDGRDV